MKPLPILLTLAGGLILSCEKIDEPVEKVAPRGVVTCVVPSVNEFEERRFSGKTKATKSVSLGFQVSGKIVEIQAVEGQRYKQGELLARLDPALYEADLRNAKAQALQARQELRRAQQLFESGNDSQANFDTAVARYQSAQSTLESANLSVNYTNLVMPYDGYVSSVPGEIDLVVNTGSPVVDIQSEQGMNFEVGVPSDTISKIKLNEVADIKIGVMDSQELKGKVTKISPAASDDTTYAVTFGILEADKVDNMRSDLDGEATLHFPLSPDEKEIALPITSVISEPGSKTFVWKLTTPEEKESTLEKVYVTVGNLSSGGSIQVLSGVKSGEVLVAKGGYQLTENTIVATSSL